MAQATTRLTTVGLLDETAQALWAAMHDDDDLANGYVDYAIFRCLKQLMREGWHLRLNEERRRRLTKSMVALYDKLDAGVDEQAERWMTYAEPPF